MTNAQGDVTALLNSSGTVVVRYTYDAWGKILSTTGSMASTLGTHNPLRYRGYVYDVETGFYYLQSRYYDPAIGRFLNADAFIATGQGFVGNNMFAYCLNNPVNLVDKNGETADSWAGWIGEQLTEWLYELFTGETHPNKQTRELENQIIEQQLSAIAPIAKIIFYNLEISGGIGQGIYYESTVLDMIGVQLGMYGNYAELQLIDGKLRYGQRVNSELSLTLFGHNLGIYEQGFMPDRGEYEIESGRGFYNDDSLTIYSVAVYPLFAGGSFRVGFDIVQFCHDIDNLFNN